MKLRNSVIAALLFSVGLFAQNPTQPQPPVDTNYMAVHMLQPPIPPSGVTVQQTGTPGSSANVYYYWLVSNFTVGNSSVGGPYPAYNVNSTLSVSNYQTVYWQPVAGANSYDLLRTSTNAQPTGACNCAVATAITGLSQTDQANALNSYTVTTFDPNDAIQSLTSEIVGGSSGYLNVHLLLKQKGALRCDLSSCGSGGSFVSNFSAGNLAPLFTTNVTNPSSTPALAFTLSNAGAGTCFGNNTGSTAAPAFFPCSSSGGANKISFDQCTPGQTTNPGNSFWFVTPLTNWDAGTWAYVLNTAADVFCSVRIPSNVTASPMQIVLDLSSSDNTAGHTATFNTADACTTARNLQVGALTGAATQLYTSTTTAYANNELTFNVQSACAADQYLIVNIHQATGGTNVANILMEPPKLKVQ